MPQNIQIGSRVKIAIDGEEREFSIVQDASGVSTGDSETITAGSQIGKALLGKQPGETVEIVVEGKPKLYRIVSIS
jgi:transcription elongation GreA/GreB family factor